MLQRMVLVVTVDPSRPESLNDPLAARVMAEAGRSDPALPIVVPVEAAVIPTALLRHQAASPIWSRMKSRTGMRQAGPLVIDVRRCVRSRTGFCWSPRTGARA